MVPSAYGAQCLWCPVPMVPCAYGAQCLWCPVPMVPSAYGALCLWCPVPMVPSAYGAQCLWCPVPMVPSAYGAQCLWCPVPMVPSAYGAQCLWCPVPMVPCAVYTSLQVFFFALYLKEWEVQNLRVNGILSWSGTSELSGYGQWKVGVNACANIVPCWKHGTDCERPLPVCCIWLQEIDFR